MDEDLTNYFDFFLFCSLYVIITLVTITAATPWFGVAALVCGVIYVRVLNFFRRALIGYFRGVVRGIIVSCVKAGGCGSLIGCLEVRLFRS